VLILTACGKSFGKPFIDWHIQDTSIGTEYIKQGKTSDYEEISKIYHDLIKERGFKNVMFLQR
jgi:hypothetical protein